MPFLHIGVQTIKKHIFTLKGVTDALLMDLVYNEAIAGCARDDMYSFSFDRKT